MEKLVIGSLIEEILKLSELIVFNIISMLTNNENVEWKQGDIKASKIFSNHEEGGLVREVHINPKN